jgi:hypothetical protein
MLMVDVGSWMRAFLDGGKSKQALFRVYPIVGGNARIQGHLGLRGLEMANVSYPVKALLYALLCYV